MSYEKLKNNLNLLCTHNETNKSVLQLTGYLKTENELIKEIVSDTQKLIDKIEQGTLIELPCKVGDVVYVPWSWDGDCAIATVDIEEIKFYDTQMHYMFFIDMMSDDESFNQEFGGWKMEQSIGKTVFLTKAEAEKKLQELKFNQRVDCGNSAIIEDDSFDCGYHEHAKNLVRNACLTEKEMHDYAKGKNCYAWHISELKIYDKPKELNEFYIYDRDKHRPSIDCEYKKAGYSHDWCSQMDGHYCNECLCDKKKANKTATKLVLCGGERK